MEATLEERQDLEISAGKMFQTILKWGVGVANLIGQMTVAAAEAVTLVSDALETETATAMAATGPQGTAVETAVTVTAAAAAVAAGAEPVRRRQVLVLLESEAVALTRTETGIVVSVEGRRGERRAARGAEATKGERGLPDLGAGLGAHPGGGRGHPSLVIQCPCQRYH